MAHRRLNGIGLDGVSGGGEIYSWRTLRSKGFRGGRFRLRGRGFVPVFHALIPMDFSKQNSKGFSRLRHALKQHGDIFAILLRKIRRNKCMENGEKQNRQSTPAGASSRNTPHHQTIRLNSYARISIPYPLVFSRFPRKFQ